MNVLPFNIRFISQMFLTQAEPVEASQWQSVDITARPEMRPRELLNCSVEVGIPSTIGGLQALVMPNLPWAEDHFMERVSGIPHNPPPSHEWWPHQQSSNEQFRSDEKFSHTYPERFWPKEAGDDWSFARYGAHRGIRFEYGDLGDVVTQLQKEPTTRQAYLPVWFPEDTGAVHGQRVPCTLGYHFIIRKGMLHCVYYIRSCDFMRHFKDDVYMACRLAQWVGDRIGADAGKLTMHITSFHIFEGDVPILEYHLDQTQ